MIYDCHNDVFSILVVAGLCQFHSWRWDTARAPVPSLMLEDIFEDDRDQSCVMITDFGGEVIFASKQKTFSSFFYEGRPLLSAAAKMAACRDEGTFCTGGNKKAKESSHFYSSVDVSSFIGPVPKVDQADDIKLVAGEIFASKQKTFSSFCYEGPFVQPLQRLLHAETKVPSAPVGTRRQKKIPSSIHLWMSYHSFDRDKKWIKLKTLNLLLVRHCCR